MPDAIRLVFVQDKGKITLQSARRIEMRVPPASKTEIDEKSIGQWIVLKNRKGEVIYRRVVSELVKSDTEASHAFAGEPMIRFPLGMRKRSFTVLVPALDDAQEVAVVERRLGEQKGAKAAARPETINHATVDLSKVEFKGRAL